MACISWRLNDPIDFAEVRGMNVLTTIRSGSGTPSDSPEDPSEELRDFDDSANALWNLYRKEAKSHDEARMQTLRDDMDGLLIFVCIGYWPMIGWPS